MAMESTKAIEEGRKPEAGDMTERDGGRGGWRGRLRPSVHRAPSPSYGICQSYAWLLRRRRGFGRSGALIARNITEAKGREEGRGQANGIARAPQV